MGKRASQAPLKRARNVAKTSGAKRKNSDWKNDLSLIKRLRSRREAPVDSIGCERLADPKACKADFEWQCLVAAMLSSQTRDQATAEAMEALHRAGLKSISTVAKAKEKTLAKLIKPVGFFNMKAKTMRAAATICKKEHKGRIPRTLEGLLKLPGIGPKMAHLIMHSAFDRQQGICVDTHVHRIANKLGWVRSKTPEETRHQLESLLPRKEWADLNVLLVGLGQMQQQAASQLISCAVHIRRSPDALQLLHRWLCHSRSRLGSLCALGRMSGWTNLLYATSSYGE
ncbi:unnamed protein product [Durusdinium trenchii]|uniref:HhH-GPD domain-containing protein n=1 Tax=Durusdinium trenchii TaxID=1381693 RepID=A0ABP0MPP8_9DINO